MNPNVALDHFDLRTLVRVTWQSKILIGAISLVMGISVYLLTYLVKPVFRVSAVVAEAHDPAGNQALMSALGQLGSLASLAGIGVESQVRPSDEGLAVLGSDEFLANFVIHYQLMPILYEDDWDPATKAWRSDVKRPPTVAKAVRKLRNLIVTARDRRTSLISINVEWTDPNIAASWCERLISDLNAEMQRRALSRAREHVLFLRKQLEMEGMLETRQAIGRLLEAELKTEMLASVSRDYVFKLVTRGVAPERDRWVSPRRALLAAMGMMAGFGIGVFVAFMRLNRARAA